MKFLLVVLAISLTPLSARADWTKVGSQEFSVADYPEEGSPEYKKDFVTLLRYQNERNDKDCRLALGQKYPKFGLLFGATAELFSGQELGAVTPLMNKVTKVADRISEYFKHQYERPRPYNEDKRIKPCADKPTGSLAYPSSHAAIAALDACVLGELFPDRAAKIKAYGRYLGDLRAITGVHHPSDVKAGQELGQDICDYLLEDETFQDDLKAVKAGLQG
jgi:acid phosphatase (class A)